MIRIRDISLPAEHHVSQLSYEAANLLKVPQSKIMKLRLIRRSIDARKKPVLFNVYNIGIKLKN